MDTNDPHDTAPPLGVMPRRIWLEMRALAVADAIARYLTCTYSLRPKDWPQRVALWSDELAKITRELEAERSNTEGE